MKMAPASTDATTAAEMSETPESSLLCLGKILYRHLGLDVGKTPKDEEILLWQCSLLLLKFRSSSRWKNVDGKAKGFLKSVVASVTRKYPLFGEKVGELGRERKLQFLAIVDDELMMATVTMILKRLCIGWCVVFLSGCVLYLIGLQEGSSHFHQKICTETIRSRHIRYIIPPPGQRLHCGRGVMGARQRHSASRVQPRFHLNFGMQLVRRLFSSGSTGSFFGRSFGE